MTHATHLDRIQARLDLAAAQRLGLPFPHEHATVAAQLAECEGVSARWCPNCGTCTCGEGFESPQCPLHAKDSPHTELGRVLVALRPGGTAPGASSLVTAPVDGFDEWKALHRCGGDGT